MSISVPIAARIAAINSHRHTLKLADVDISYLQWRSQGEPVLLLHGLGDCAAVWVGLMEALSNGSNVEQQYQCVAVDLRGHGDSGKPAIGYRAQDIIGDLNALITNLGWQSAHVIAHSWSAKVAAIWAQQEPQRFKSLTLVDPAFINKMPGWMAITFPLFYRILPFLKMLGPFASYEAAQQQAQQLKQYRGWQELQQVAFAMAIEQKTDGNWGSKFVVQARDQVFAEFVQVPGLTQAIDLPTLLLIPEQGLNRTDWQLKPFDRYVTNLQRQSIPGNHWAFLVEPAAFNQAVIEFLAQNR
jgi:pimeloyl-ACP methyl ester carboxylesterase